MTEQSKASVPTTIGGSSNGGGNGANSNNNNGNANGNGNDNNQGRRGNGRRGKGNGNGQRKADVYDNAASVRGAFKKDDDASVLGVMHQHYFDCYDISDQVRFNITLEKLQQYASENYKRFGRAISAGIADPSKRPTVPDVQMPQKMDTTTNQMVDKEPSELSYGEKMKLDARFKMQIQRELELEEEVGVLYGFIFRRCTTLLQDRLRTHKRYDQIHASSDPFELLQIIRETVYKTEDTAYVPLSAIDQMEAILATRQGNLSVPQYHAQFKSMLEAMST
jgi:hypothetical protein